MLDQKLFVEVLKEAGVEFFAGVPDSYLNGFCNYLQDNIPADKQVVAANEGNALSIAAGYYFGSGIMPLVYLQNSGLGNIINPLASLVDRHVYKVPMVLLIGWRGEPGAGDHAQHITQGQITPGLLDLLEIPYIVAEDDDHLFAEQLAPLLRQASESRKVVAILGRKGVFAAADKANPTDDTYPLNREEAIEAILDLLPADTFYLATTGRATRELYYLREKRKEGHQFDFLNLGAMGHLSSIAQGLALSDKNKRVVCLDGDAAALMHLGAFTMASALDIPNFIHIVLNNGAHESVGGQPSSGHVVDFTAIAGASAYNTVDKAVTTKEELARAIDELSSKPGPAFIDFRIHKGLKGDLPPLDINPEDLLNGFMEELAKE